MVKSRFLLITLLGMLLAICSISSIYAESAPVYDADALDQPMDEGNQELSQADLPPPPPPSENEVFVPLQPQATPGNQQAQQNVSMERRVKQLEQQLSMLQNNVGGLENPPQAEALQNQLQALRTQVEDMNTQLAQLENQQKTLASNLENRLSQLSQNNRTNTAPQIDSANNAEDNAEIVAKNKSETETVTQPKNDQPNVVQEQQVYQTAYNLIKAKKYNDAANILQNMLKKYPSGQFASNAHYWLGELYGLMGKNDKALNEFNNVINNFPQSPRVSDALLKVGLIFAAQSKWNDAKGVFKKVINQYPGTASSRLASEQLKQIKQSGH